MDAALSLAPAPAPAPARFTVLHVTSSAAADLVETAARRLGRPCERLEIQDQSERAVVAASAHADLLIVARDGDRSRLGWPDAAPDVGTMPPPPHHPHLGER